ncbi:glucose-6-phosphate dehydrogenase assembly protein OpcA [Quadrisphaera granulorum]|nr:glucose-6-phosphate dehydrogenase assembly protein OpcA [Quadrisphaera granulorum]
MPRTSTAAIAKRLVHLRDSGGAVALGRVLTLVVPTDDEHAEAAIEAANDASREHPCRILVLAAADERGTSRLDGQIRVGGDAGASEVIVLRSYGPLTGHGASMVIPLLLPDAPVVVWWPGEAPEHPATDPIGSMAQRRITDAAASPDPVAALHRLAAHHVPGDTDFAWSRLTLWRGLLAAAFDQVPADVVTSATVTGASNSPSTELLAAWLALALQCPVTRVSGPAGGGIVGVRLERPSGVIELARPDSRVATLTQPGQPERRLALPRRSNRDCLAEELRRLDPDDIYGEVLTHGLAVLDAEADSHVGLAEAHATGRGPDVAEQLRHGAELDAAAHVRAAAIQATPSVTDKAPATAPDRTPEKVSQKATVGKDAS